jgi:C-terminal processing protease CtpA/Prc
MKNFINYFVAIAACAIVAGVCYSLVRNKNKLESAFKQTLFAIQQNSIKNFEWNERDWQNYQNNQIKRLPIFTKEYFYNCVENALKDLHDNHSVLIKKHKLKNLTIKSNVPAERFSIKVEGGIGIINFPTLITEVNQQDAILHEEWVTEFNKQVESIAPQVTDGWIIDLTQNTGGNMYPMLAALSYFYDEPILGGFYSRIKNKTEKTLVSFDGESFKFNNEPAFTYKIKFKTNQNKLPVIALIGKNTASSAEFVALALKRQKHIILAGHESQGVATGNEVMPLPDYLGNYMLTGAYFLDTNNQPLLEEKVSPAITLDNENMISGAKQLVQEGYLR